MRRRGISLLIPLLFLGMVLLIGCTVVPMATDFSQIDFFDEEQNSRLTPFYDEVEDRYYLFLPSYLPLEQISVEKPWYLRVNTELAEETYEDLCQVPMNQLLACTLSTFWGQRETYWFQIMQCSANRTIRIETSEG